MDKTASNLDAAVAAEQQAADLRLKITEAATGAVHYGSTDPTWVNGKLAALGAQPVPYDAAEYRLNVPITGLLGVTIHAANRTEARERFDECLENLGGKINDCHTRGYNVYDIELNPAAGDVKFYSGPEDPDQGEDVPALTLDELKAGIQAMLREGVGEKGWGWRYANQTLRQMGLEVLPKLTYRTVEIPVSGITKVGVQVFEDDTDERVLEAVKTKVVGMGSVTVKPDEMGTPVVQE